MDDTQGMFLLLGAGFLIGTSALFLEIFGNCFNCCKKKRRDSTSTIESNPRFHERQALRNYQPAQYVRRFSSHAHQHNQVQVQVHQHNDTETQSNNSISHQEIEAKNMTEEVDRIFENVFGEKFNHEDPDQESITTN